MSKLKLIVVAVVLGVLLTATIIGTVDFTAINASASGISDSVLLPNTYMSVYRIYNPDNGDHLYTTNAYECEVNINNPASAWKADGTKSYDTDVTGTAWFAPMSSISNTPVYRIYNPANGDHVYTRDVNEMEVNCQRGWVKETADPICWYSADDKSCIASVRVPVYRLYNSHHPSYYPGSHHYTTDPNERDTMLSWTTADGQPVWTYEGIAWYGVPDQVAVSRELDAERPTVTIEDDTSYVAIEANVIVHNTNATGVNGGITISSPSTGNIAGFEVSYEDNKKAQFPWYKENADFVLENIYDPNHVREPGTEGKYYLHLGEAKREQEYKIRLTWNKQDQHLRAYVNDKEVTYGYDKWTGIVMSAPFTVSIGGAGKHGGDVVDVEYKDVKIKAGDGRDAYGLGFSNEWVTTEQNYFGIRATQTDEGSSGMAIGEKFTIKDYSGEDKGIGFNSAFRISGTSLIPAGYDWDTCVNAIEPTTGRRGIAAAGANAFINQYY